MNTVPTTKEIAVLCELARLIGTRKSITAMQLSDLRFAETVERIHGIKVGYPQSLQSRYLQHLRNCGFLKMKNGVYILSDLTS